MKRGAEYDKETFPDFLDLIYFVKQFVALVIGIVWGILPFTGAFGLLTGVVASFGIPLLYANRYLRVNTEDFDVMTILSEGAMPTFALFLLSWILCYTTFHY
ncbi:hypothetical protein BLSTO_00390 [Blastocystis sp. subtype 1]